MVQMKNIREYFHYLDFSKHFINMMQNKLIIKKRFDILDFMKIKETVHQNTPYFENSQKYI